MTASIWMWPWIVSINRRPFRLNYQHHLQENSSYHDGAEGVIGFIEKIEGKVPLDFYSFFSNFPNAPKYKPKYHSIKENIWLIGNQTQTEHYKA